MRRSLRRRGGKEGWGRGYRRVPGKPASPTHVPNTLCLGTSIDSHPGAGRWVAARGWGRWSTGGPAPHPYLTLPALPEAKSTKENLQPSPPDQPEWTRKPRPSRDPGSPETAGLWGGVLRDLIKAWAPDPRAGAGQMPVTTPKPASESLTRILLQ